MSTLVCSPTLAQDATWRGTVSGDYLTGGNWNTGTPPVGTGIFNATGVSTTITIAGASTAVGGWRIEADAPQYDFVNNAGVTFRGAGLTRLTTELVIFDNNLLTSQLFFENAASGGTARYTNRGDMRFLNSSTAGGAQIFNDRLLFFENTSSAGTATISGTGDIVFIDSSTGATAQLTLGGGLLDVSARGGVATIGALSGTGTVALGSRTLAIGGLGLTTTFGGVIQDGGGLIGGTGGGIVKTGAGTLILTGTNTYTGGTTIDQGTLQLGAGGATGSIVGDIVTNGTLAFNRSNTLTFAGTIIGTGAVRQIGNGTTILTGNNSYTGGTTITAGTLRLGAGGTTGSIVGNVTNNGVLVFDRSDIVTLAGAIGGTGAVQHAGAGTTILTGANSYTGGTTIAVGTLQIGDGGTTGAIVGAVANGGTLAFARSDTVAFGGTITGTGLVRQIGSGTLVLGGANGYSGGTDLVSGTLAIQNAGALGSGSLRFTGGTLRSDVGATLGNAIDVGAGNGTIAAATGQVLTLTGPIGMLAGSTALRFGTADAAGGVDVASATLGTIGSGGFTVDVVTGAVRGSNAALGTLTSLATATNIAAGARLELGFAAAPWVRNLQLAGTLAIDGSVTASIGQGLAAGTIEGAGALSVATPGSFAGGNSGVLVLTGVASHTGGTGIQSGATLRVGAGGTVGTLGGNVANDGTLVFARSDAVTFAGVISGTGVLTQAGTGTLNLTGANTYTGATTVAAGALVVTGTIDTSSGLTVASGALVGGTGVLPSTTVFGTLSPGTSIGTLSVNGALNLGGGATYLVELQGATSDRTIAAGAAALGGTMRVVPLGGAYLFNTRYVVLSAGGPLTGTFAQIDSRLGAAVVPVLSYEANTVVLTLTAIPLAPTAPAQPPNQQGVVDAIDRGIASGGDANPFQPLFALPAANLSQALGQLSGEVHTAVSGLGIAVAGPFLAAMLDPLASSRESQALAFAPETRADGAAVRAATRASGTEAFDTRRFALWAAGFGADGAVRGRAEAGTTRRHERASGLAAGVDVTLAPGIVIGVALAGGGAGASLDNGLGTVSAEVFQAGAYARTRLFGLELSAALAYARLEIDTTRAVPVLGLPAVTGGTDADVWSGRIEASYRFDLAGLSVAPLAAYQRHSVSVGGFVERTPDGVAPAAALAVDGRTATTARTELGVLLASRFAAGGVEADGSARVAWAHYLERDSAATLSFVGLPGSAFTIEGARPDRDAALLSAGIDLRLSPQLTIGARFDGEFSDAVSRYTGTARVRFAF